MEDRRYFFIRLPHDNIIHALDIRLGDNVNETYNIAHDVIYIKTTQKLIDIKVNSRDTFNTIFPPGLTTEVTLTEAQERIKSIEFTKPII